METLKLVLEKQKELQERLNNPMGLGEKAAKENILALVVEAAEVLDEINWKPWKSTTKEINRDALLLELIDILQFWANIVNEMGFTEAEIKDAYQRKVKTNLKRITDGY